MNIRKIRVEKIRQFMIKEKLDAYLILSADPHLNEYLPSFYQSRAFVSGFKGSGRKLNHHFKMLFYGQMEGIGFKHKRN